MFNQSHKAYITPLVIYGLGGGHTHTHTHTHAYRRRGQKQYQETRLAPGLKVTNVNYLGITFDYYISWKSHINVIAAKANATQAFVSRNTNFCPSDVTTYYKTLVGPIMKHSATPFTAVNITTLERVTT